MPGHYKKGKMNKKKRVNKVSKMKKQKGGQMKKNVHCVCSRNHHPMGMQTGGRLLSPAAMKLLQRQHPDFRTLPVKTKQRGMGHCGKQCIQCGGSFFGDIGKAFSKVGKAIVSNPLRLAGAIGTLGLSETFLTPSQLIRDATGVKTSTVLDKAAPLLSKAGGKELALAGKLTSKGLQMVGLGRRR